MLYLIILLPFLGFIFSIMFGRLLGKGALLLTTSNIFLSFVLSVYIFKPYLNDYLINEIYLLPWMCVDVMDLYWAIYFDSLTVIMLLVVTFISLLVHIYSISYMSEDPHKPRFMSYLSLFTFFMLILVTANNFLHMFVGWEGVGVSSYLLINFWFTRIQANKSAIKAMLLNRVGDFFLLLAIFLIYYCFDTVEYLVVFATAENFNNFKCSIGFFDVNILDLICLFLLFGAMGKSAQLGLHTWLPDAMEGPTPVSALIHAATMVTAGIFLIVRCSYLFENSNSVLFIMAIIGALTAFFGASTGVLQNDIKKIIAYSTCSQLGYMLFSCGLSNYHIAFFHLYNHAFFKALLFLGAGSVIHAALDEQDIRKMGGFLYSLPFSYTCFMIGSLALTGFPFLTGFYSKDLILEMAISTQTTIGYFCFYLGILVAFLTAFYSSRIIFLVFLSHPNANRVVFKYLHEGSWELKIALFILSILSIFIGFFSSELFIGLGTDYWQTAIFIQNYNSYHVDVEFLTIYYKLLPLFYSLLGIYLAFILYNYNILLFFKLKLNKTYYTIYTFFIKKWYIDRIYNHFISQNILNFSLKNAYNNVDRGILEKFGPFGISQNLYNFLKLFNIGKKENFHLFFYEFFILIVILLILYFISLYIEHYYILILSFFGMFIIYYNK